MAIVDLFDHFLSSPWEKALGSEWQPDYVLQFLFPCQSYRSVGERQGRVQHRHADVAVLEDQG